MNLEGKYPGQSIRLIPRTILPKVLLMKKSWREFNGYLSVADRELGRTITSDEVPDEKLPSNAKAIMKHEIPGTTMRVVNGRMKSWILCFRLGGPIVDSQLLPVE